MLKSSSALFISTMLIVTPISYGEESQELGSEESSEVFLERVSIEQRFHSSSKGFEAGERNKLEAAFQYQPSTDSFFRLRFDTDPKKNPKENKTSELELIMNHRVLDFEIQADLKTDLDAGDTGGISFGPDVNSEDSFIRYNIMDELSLTLYPFNFKKSMGEFFYMYNITQIFYIDGTPDVIPQVETADVSLRNKSLPGFDVSFKPIENLAITVGVGAARYLYPSDPDFTLEIPGDQNGVGIASDSWQSKTDTGLKLGVELETDIVNVSFEYLTHNNADETGSLMESAANLQVVKGLGIFELGMELAYSKAGENAYNVTDDFKWFAEDTLFRPVYSDEYGVHQNWLGEVGFAYHFKLKYLANPSINPYIAYSLLGENFIFWDEESAHRLRTADRALSHGGLKIYGLGVDFLRGKYSIRPEFEYLAAKNEVFHNKTDLRSAENLTSRNKNQSRVTLYVTYEL